MKKNEIKNKGFYWIKRPYIGKTIGYVEYRNNFFAPGTDSFVTFPGEAKKYDIGRPCSKDPTRIEPRRFIRRVK